MGQDASKTKAQSLIHPSALIEKGARIGAGTRVWAFAQIRKKAVIGPSCVVGNGAYIDTGVRLGKRCNIHNKALLYRNLEVEDDVFIGPGVCFTNDPHPRANRIRKLGKRRGLVKRGASVGANATIMPDLTLGRYCLVAAGAVVTKSVPDYALVAGVPAKEVGRVDAAAKTRGSGNPCAKRGGK